MSDVTQILDQIQQGDPSASERLWPLVYDELRKLAAAKLAQEKPGQTLQATSLVHEAYLRLVGSQNEYAWDNRGHFFTAAAEAMRRILIDQARRKQSQKRGGELQRLCWDEVSPTFAQDERTADELLMLDEALTLLEAEDPAKAKLVKLRYFAGLTLEEASASLGISVATAKRHWIYARAWLFGKIAGQ